MGQSLKSLKNNFYNDFKGTEYLLAAVNLENEIDTCQTTVRTGIKVWRIPRNFTMNAFQGKVSSTLHKVLSFILNVWYSTYASCIAMKLNPLFLRSLEYSVSSSAMPLSSQAHKHSQKPFLAIRFLPPFAFVWG